MHTNTQMGPCKCRNSHTRAYGALTRVPGPGVETAANRSRGARARRQRARTTPSHACWSGDGEGAQNRRQARSPAEMAAEIEPPLTQPPPARRLQPAENRDPARAAVGEARRPANPATAGSDGQSESFASGRCERAGSRSSPRSQAATASSERAVGIARTRAEAQGSRQRGRQRTGKGPR